MMQISSQQLTLARPVRLVGYRAGLAAGGINNYIGHLHTHLSALGVGAQVRGADVRRFFHVAPYRAGEILHVPLIMGAQVLLTRKFPHAVVTVHDLGGLLFSVEQQHGSILHKVMFRLALQGVRRAQHVLAVSEYTKQMLIKYLRVAPERITVTYEAAERTTFRPRPQVQARQQLAVSLGIKFPSDQPVLLYVGSELPRKNLQVVWQALKRLRQTYPGASVLKVGAPGNPTQRAATLQTIERCGQRDAVHFLHNIDAATLAQFYNAADIFVQPSLYEGFSLPTVEAMASGCPVIAADATCLPEVVGTGGRLFDPTSPVQLADAILTIYEDDHLRQALIEQGQRRAAAFNWNTTAQQTLAVYNTMA